MSTVDPKQRVLISGGAILTLDKRLGDFASGDLLIKGDKIAAVGPRLNTGAVSPKRQLSFW